jgi:prepilin-type N-terminal cleavage/methylation domain-containing protein
MGIGRGTRSDRGMTLPEVMIASSILLVCLTSLAGLLAGAVNSSSNARMRDEAANLANARIEAARSLGYDHVGVRYASGVSGDPAGDILTPDTDGPFTVVTACTWIRTPAGRAAYKQLTVTVSWQKPTPSQVQVTTMIYGKSDIATSGDLDVKLRYREDGAPVTDSAIAIRASDNVVRALTADSGGEAFFGQVPVGAVALAVTPPAGYVVDSSNLSSVTVSADAVTTVIVYVQKPASTTIIVADTNGAPIAGASVALRRADGTDIAPVLTDAGGNAVFADLLYSDYSATVTKAGYAAASLPFTVSVGQPAPVVSFSMSPNLGISLLVSVFDANGTQAPGAVVTVTRNGNNTDTQQGTTGSNGQVSFSGLQAVAYTVAVAKNGYVTQSQTVQVNTTLTSVDIHLEAAASNGNLHITTLDKNGHTGAIQVVVSGSGYYRSDLMSDSSGNLMLTGLVTGSYTVQCFTNPASVATVIISAGQTADVTVSQSKK